MVWIMECICNIIKSQYFSNITDMLIVVGTIVTIIIALWGKDQICHWLFNAKLKIELNHSYTNIPRFYQNGIQVNYFYLKLKNSRTRIEKNVRVYLNSFAKMNNGCFNFVSYPVPLQLVWSPAESTPAVIDVSKEQMIDFLKLENVNGSFLLSPVLYNTPFGFKETLQSGDCIRFELKIMADYVTYSQIYEIDFKSNPNHTLINDVGSDIEIKEV